MVAAVVVVIIIMPLVGTKGDNDNETWVYRRQTRVGMDRGWKENGGGMEEMVRPEGCVRCVCLWKCVRA